MKPFRYTRQYRDRHGRLRIEFRYRGKTIPLRATPGTAEFQDEYDRARLLMEGDPSAARAPGVRKPLANTLRWLCAEWFGSAEFEQLAASTRKDRRLILEAIWDEPIRPGSKAVFADCPLAALTSEHVKVLRDRKKHAPNAANARLKTLHVLFKWGRGKGSLVGNPASDVDKLQASGDGHHVWTEAECEQFRRRYPLGSRARLAFELLFGTGCRRSDVVLLGRQHLHNGRLTFTQTKNRRRKPVSVEIPVTAELQQAIDATELGDLAFLTNEAGRPFTAEQFGDWFRRKCDDVGLRHCSAHGVRKARATFLANSGCTAHELMAILGWLSLSEAARYTREADRRRNAERGMARAQSKN
jgi:integrase